MGSALINKDSLVIVKENFGELMLEGLHKYNRRHYLLNIEKKRRKGILMGRSDKKHNLQGEMSEGENQGGDLGGILNPEERNRFYKVLFDESAP